MSTARIRCCSSLSLCVILQRNSVSIGSVSVTVIATNRNIARPDSIADAITVSIRIINYGALNRRKFLPYDGRTAERSVRIVLMFLYQLYHTSATLLWGAIGPSRECPALLSPAAAG